MHDGHRRSGDHATAVAVVTGTPPGRSSIGASPASWLHRVSLVAAVAAFGLAAWLIHHYLMQLAWSDVASAWSRLPAHRIAGSLLATAVSFAMLGAFEVQAARVAAPGRLSPGLAGFGGAAANAIGNALGFHALTSTAVRYRLYTPAGLTTGDIARIISVAGMGVGLGFAVSLTAALCWSPTGLDGWGRWPGLMLLTMLLALLALLGRHGRQLRLWGWQLRLPGAAATARQMLIGGAEMLAAISALYVLLPPGVAPPLAEFMPIYVGAVLAGIVSHAPAGAGVFEAIMLASVAPAARADLLAAMLCYRITYNLVPFALGALALAAFEWRRKRLRPATGTPGD